MEGTSFWKGMKKATLKAMEVGHKEATSIKSGNKTGRDTVSAIELSGYYTWKSEVQLEHLNWKTDETD